jgi:8-oxo-dGTP pyrophosphatase MutT (NUDIX family)
MPLVKCRTLFNQTRLVLAESMIHRPSVYGVVVQDDRVLLAKAHYTQKYVLPGGGIDLGEAIDGALRREVREETGVEIEVGEFLHFQTDFFYYDPMALAIHGFLFFYRCTPLTAELNAPEYPPEEDLEFPAWVAIADLSAADFQAHGEITIQLIESCRAHS